MRFKIVATALSVLCLMGVMVVAADVTGTWVAEMTGGKGGPMETTFNLKADGSTLTGTNVGPMGSENEIIEGKVDGNNVSFAVKIDMMGNEMKINYKGEVVGDEMRLTMEFEGGPGGPGGGPGGKPMEIVAKRQK